MRFLRYFLFSFFIIVAGSAGSLFYLITIPWVDFSVLDSSSRGKPSIVLDDEGREWTRFQIDRRQPVAFDQIPVRLINAFLAAEDHAFFSHGGLSFRGIARSIVINILKGKKVQGASTITQQLVRLLFFDQQKTFRRKIKEQVLSIAVERQYTKEFILETYLNNLYFGCGIYGIQAACERFWGIEIDHISIDQAATLAAIIACPARYCPLINPINTHSRRNTVLRSMRDRGFISDESFKQAHASPIRVNAPEQDTQAPHAREHIRLFLEGLVGKNELYTGGLTIQTTLNQKLQNKAASLFTSHFEKLKKRLGDDVDGALLSINVKTGEIKALVGGYDFKKSQFDRVFSAQRQIGSVIKPIIYSAALESGFDFDHVEVDEPIMINDHNQPWTPHNYNNLFDGPMTLAHALATSKNTIAVKMLLHTGIDAVVNHVRKFRLADTIEPYPSLALGCIDTSLAKATAMFNVFPNKGTYVEPYLISWIKDCRGKKIWKHRQNTQTIMQWNTSDKVTRALSIGFERIKKIRPDLFDGIGAVCSKTGTTNQSRTCWFAGSTPKLTTAIYIGRDNNRSLGAAVYPNATILPLWLDFNRHETPTDRTFEYDPSLEPVLINAFTGVPIDPDNDATQQQIPAGKVISILKTKAGL